MHVPQAYYIEPFPSLDALYVHAIVQQLTDCKLQQATPMAPCSIAVAPYALQALQADIHMP